MSSRIMEHLVKDLRDLKVLEYILENMEVEFDIGAFRSFEAELKGQGMIWYNFIRIHVQRLFIEYMGVQRTIVFLRRHPLEIERIIKVIEESDDKFYDAIRPSPFEVVNFGDNIDSRLVSPTLFKKYYLPYYQRRVEELHRKGKFVICHVDGYAKPLLPFFKEAG